MFSTTKKNCAIILLFFLQCNYINQSSCDCLVKITDIDIQSSESPLILKSSNHFQQYAGYSGYSGSNNDLDFFYPAYTDNKCLTSNMFGGMNSIILNLACPGHSLKFPNFPNSTIESTHLIREDRQYPEPPLLSIPEFSTSFSSSAFNSTPIKCSGVSEPRMKKLDDDTYQIGIQVNVLDFLPVINLLSNEKNNIICAHVNVLSIIEKRPKIAEDTTFLKGLLYEKASLEELDEMYSMEDQLKIFSDVLPKDIFQKYMGENYLVKGQLISKDDLFYIPQQRSTFFYENTVPIWKSINEGNWKTVGGIIRKLAHQSVKDLNVFSGAFGKATLKSNEFTYNLNISKDESSSISNLFVPEVLFKVIYDPQNEQRSIAFLTINDPHVIVNSDGKIDNENTACCKKSECHFLYPEFLNSTKGYTCCCSLNDFKVWDSIRSFSEIPLSSGSYSRSRFFPVPPPPPHPMPLLAASPSKK